MRVFANALGTGTGRPQDAVSTRSVDSQHCKRPGKAREPTLARCRSPVSHAKGVYGTLVTTDKLALVNFTSQKGIGMLLRGTP